MTACYIIPIILISLAVAIGRFTVPGHGLSYPGLYEALAHIAVGMLIACAWFRVDVRRLAMVCVAAITVLEIVKFATQ